MTATATTMATMPGDHVARLGTILGVWAHPDDEAFLSAGLMALARRNGQRVVVVTAMAGEVGNPDPVRCTTGALAAAPRRELVTSLAVVGAEEHHWLGFADGGCGRAPLEGAAAVEDLVRRVRPDTILTFGPDGMTGHPDHRAVSVWATAAWRTSGRRTRLYYATLTSQFHDQWHDLNRQASIWLDGSMPPCTPVDRLAIAVQCRGEPLELKVSALRAHASQVGPLIAAVGEATFGRWWAGEWFTEPDARAERAPAGAAHAGEALASREAGA